MTAAAGATTDAIGELERRAVAAQAEELRFRTSVAAEIAARETARVHAFRRLGLMRATRRAVAGADDAAGARAAAVAALAGELGWTGSTELQARTLEAFARVADAVRADACADAPETDATGRDAPAPPPPLDALAAFEAWFEDSFGSPFLALLGQEPLEVPVVEF